MALPTLAFPPLVRLGVLVASGLLLGACGGDDGPDEAAPQAATCPSAVPATARCLQGQDSAGAYYLIAMPQDWNGHLVLHAQRL